MSEPSLETFSEDQSDLSLETHFDQVLIDQNIANSKSVISSIKGAVAKVVDKILS